MQRIVNGHYANPDSTRDLLGITQGEFELIIRIIQERIKGLDMLFELPEDSRAVALQQMAEMHSLDVGDAYKTMQQLEDYFTNDYNLMYKILSDINQPYPGTFDRQN